MLIYKILIIKFALGSETTRTSFFRAEPKEVIVN